MPIPISGDGGYDPGWEYVTPQPDFKPVPAQTSTDTPTGTTTTQPVTVEELANALKSNLYANKPGGVAGYLDWLNAQGLLPDSVRNAAQIQKDAWLHRGGGGGGGRGGYRSGLGNNYDWQQAFEQNPDLNNIDWQAWAEAYGYVPAAGYSPEQPVMNWNPRALPAQYRQSAEQQFRNWGLRPTGSLGTAGYTQYTPRNPGQPYKPLDVNLFNAIPDESLRKWMQWYAQQAGLINGNYEKPGY